MTSAIIRQPAIALVDDDFHSARLMLRMLAAHDAPLVDWLGGDPEKAFDSVLKLAALPLTATRLMVLVDLKSSSTASRDFIERLLHACPDLLVVAMAPSLDRDTRNQLLDAGAAAGGVPRRASARAVATRARVSAAARTAVPASRQTSATRTSTVG